MAAPLPRLAITIGDAAGIGPEIALRVLQDPQVEEVCAPCLVGPARLIQRVAQHLDLPLPCGSQIEDVGTLDADEVVPGQFSAQTGRASYEAVCRAVDMVHQGRADAIVTGPIQKEAWAAAEIAYPGHTELLAARGVQPSSDTPADVRMMLASDSIACVLETIHIPLADVPKSLSTDSLAHTITLAGQTIRRKRQRRGSLLPPRIGVCGLNPHAGEHGLFSYGEEEQIIQPAIERARDEGWDVIGPLAPDTAFTPLMRSQIDVYVCMYHDQGLIPLKAISFDDAVNVTLGLPIIRTSVDHGTAMDLAWKGTAMTSSLLAAIRLAAELCCGSQSS